MRFSGQLSQVWDAAAQRLDHREERGGQAGGAPRPAEAAEQPEQVCQVHIDWQILVPGIVGYYVLTFRRINIY